MGTCSLLTIDPASLPPSILFAPLPCSRMAVWECSEVGKRERERDAVRTGGGGKEKRRGREVVEYCSADKLMQHSRLSQQHTPRLAQCFYQLVPKRSCPGEWLAQNLRHVFLKLDTCHCCCVLCRGAVHGTWGGTRRMNILSGWGCIRDRQDWCRDAKPSYKNVFSVRRSST